MDENEELVTRFNVILIPTTLFVRGGASAHHIVAEIKGGGSDFINKFYSIFSTNATAEEIDRVERYRNGTVLEGKLEDYLENIALSKQAMDILAEKPLHECMSFVTPMTRKELGIPVVDSNLAFDVSGHDAAKSTPAMSVLSRFKDDVAAYATQVNSDPVLKVLKLTDKLVYNYFSGDTAAEEFLTDALKRVKFLHKKLILLRDSDADMIYDTLPLLEKASNLVPLSSQSPRTTLTSSTSSSSSGDEVNDPHKMRFILNRVAGRNAYVWKEFMFGILLSSQGEADLLRLNPYLPPQTVRIIMSLVTVIMLRSNRLGQTNRCIGMVISLQGLLEKVCASYSYCYMHCIYIPICIRHMLPYYCLQL